MTFQLQNLQCKIKIIKMLKNEIYKALERPVGKDMLDMYFMKIDGYEDKLIHERFNIDFNDFRIRFKVVEERVQKFLIQNGYSDYADNN